MYTFSGWSTNPTRNGKTYRSDGTDTLKMPLAPVTLHAKWVIDAFTMTFISTATTVSYDTVRIGTQTWMVQNLRTTRYNDGMPIPNIIEHLSPGKKMTHGG